MFPKQGVESCQKHTSFKKNEKATFFSHTEEWVLQVTSIKEPEERELVRDSGASMHMVSKKDFDSAELETMRTSRCKREKKPQKMSNNWT